jgi:hypothetical protein
VIDYRPIRPVEEKLDTIRKAAQSQFPTGDIETVLEEIERGRFEAFPLRTEVPVIELKIEPCPDH